MTHEPIVLMTFIAVVLGGLVVVDAFRRNGFYSRDRAITSAITFS